jgi:hypothetical protein
MIENWCVIILAHKYSQLKEGHLADGSASESTAKGSNQTANIGNLLQSEGHSRLPFLKCV